MLTPTHWCWIAAGSPSHPDCEPTPDERCWVCAGQAPRSMARGDWLGASYTGQNRVRYPQGMRICEPCVWVHSRTYPVPGRPPAEGKTLGGNWRNYSCLVEVVDGVPHLVTASKGEKPLVLAWLQRAKRGLWFAALADSGQKHVIPTAPMNTAHGRRVLFEEQEVLLPREPGWALVSSMADLLTLDVSKEAIGPGEYTALQYGHSAAEIAAFEERWGLLRGCPWWSLALWLAQRDETRLVQIQAQRKESLRAHQGPKRRPAKRDDQHPLGDPAGVPGDGGKRLGPLAAAPVADPPRSEEQHDRGGVVQHPEPRPAPASGQQLTLF